jgi:putative nucleotidyltransferase with HDIG domain
MDALQLEAKLSGLKKISTLPEVMAGVVRLCEQPEISITELADVVRSDVALTARILKVVNSPFFGRPQQIRSISQAVSTLGANRVKSLALSLSLYDMSHRIGKNIDLKDFWRHSLNVACISELIAQRVNPSLTEEAFVCGCLHDIGILALDHTCPEEYEQVCKSTEMGNDLVSGEREVIGLDHAVAGEMLARMWSFPETYCHCIAKHHDVVEPKEPVSSNQLSFILNLADRLATFTIENMVASSDGDFTSRTVLAGMLGLTLKDLKDVEVESISSFMRTASYLEFEVGSTEILLQKATEHLYELYCVAEDNYGQLRKARNRLQEDQLNRAALESLQAIVATFSHYLNNAVATISGRTQLLELALKDKDVEDRTGIVAKSIGVYQKSSEQIIAVIEKLKKINVYRTAIYHDDTKIIDLDNSSFEEPVPADETPAQ